MRVEKFASIVGGISSLLQPNWEVGTVQALRDELRISSFRQIAISCFPGLVNEPEDIPYGGFTSVTLVLWAALPAQRLTREGQHKATVQK